MEPPPQRPFGPESARVSEHQSDQIYSVRLSGANDEIRKSRWGLLRGERRSPLNYQGEVAEWLKALVSKTSIPATVSGVRIPPSP